MTLINQQGSAIQANCSIIKVTHFVGKISPVIEKNVLRATFFRSLHQEAREVNQLPVLFQIDEKPGNLSPDKPSPSPKFNVRKKTKVESKIL